MTANAFRTTLFTLFVGIFAITALITLLGVTGQVTIKAGYLNTLFGSLIMELVAAVIALFRGARFFETAPELSPSHESPSRAIASSAELVSSSLFSLVQGDPKTTDSSRRSLTEAYGVLFHRLRILQPDEKGDLRPVSERADSFLRILSHTAKAHIAFCGDWHAEGSHNKAANQLGDILERIETFRVQESGGISGAPAARTACSSLVLIKALMNAEPVFLLKWSSAWGGYFWFVGGIQESVDLSAETCAVRELKEELGLTEIAIQGLRIFTSATDKRISKRQHVLTDYTYNLFSAAIDESAPAGSSLLRPEFTIERTVKGHRIEQRCKWFSWEQIKSSPNLVSDAAVVLDSLNRFGIDRIPFSFRTEVAAADLP